MSYSWVRKWTPDDADRLFNEDGTVRLPKAIGLAIGMAASALRDDRPACLTKQPTEERCLKVADALRDRVVERGYDMAVRPSRDGEWFGLYLVPAEVSS